MDGRDMIQKYDELMNLLKRSVYSQWNLTEYGYFKVLKKS